MTTRALGGYLDEIVSLCGCTPAQAPAVEELMRLGTHNGCLDHLPPDRFEYEAALSYLALQELLADGDTYWTAQVAG